MTLIQNALAERNIRSSRKKSGKGALLFPLVTVDELFST